MGASGAVDGGDGGERAHFSRWAFCTVHLSRQAVIPRGTQGGSTSTAFIASRANAAARALKKRYKSFVQCIRLIRALSASAESLQG